MASKPTGRPRLVYVSAENVAFSPLEGGATNGQRALLKYLESFDVRIVARRGRSAEYADFPVHHVPLLPARVLRRALKPLARLLKREAWSLADTYSLFVVVRMLLLRPKIIYVFNRPEWSPRFRFFYPGAAIVVRMGNDHFERATPKEIERWATAIDRILSPSAFLSRKIGLHSPSLEAKVVTIRPGIDAQKFMPGDGPPAAESAAYPLSILFVGRLTPDKGVHLLVEAFEKIRDNFPTARLLIVGAPWFGSRRSSEFEQEIRQAAGRQGSSVEFLGSVPHDQLPDIHRMASVFVAPSVWDETWGMMNLEAMSSGLPVISSRRGGIPECVGSAGILLQRVSSQTIANAVLQVFSSPDLARSYSSAARARAKSVFDWSVVGPEYDRFFNGLLE